MGKAIVAYCRVSTAEQDTESQIHAIRGYCERQGWTLGRIYEDQISGAADRRPALDELKADCLKGKLGTILVFRFDRLARSTAHLLECLKLFQESGVDFISVSEGIDTSTSVGKMVLTFLGAIGEFERSIIRERVQAGVDRAKAAGIHCGRPRKGFDVAAAIKLRAEGKSLREIAAEVHVNYATVKRYLDGVAKASRPGNA